MSKMSVVSALGKHVDEGIAIFKRWAGGNPEAVKLAARRLGLDPSKSTVASIVSAAKDNPMTTALLMVETGEMGYDIVRSMAEQSPEIASMAERYGLLSDTVTSATKLSDIGKLKDEFACIREASNIVGGYDRLLTLRRALSMDLGVFTTYETVKALKA
jgi:hypothetical protein